MKALVIVILVLSVLLLIPIGIDGGYKSRTVVLGLRVGFLNIRVLPKKPKHGEPKLKKPPKLKKLRKDEEKPEKALKLDAETLRKLLPIALKSLGRLRRKIHVDYLRLRYTFASDDPFKTAMAYGAASAALSAVLPLLDEAFEIGEADIGTSFDFLSDEPVLDCWLTTTIHLWEVFYIAIALGIDFLKLKLRHKLAFRTRKDG
jgi:hypothetical protein